MKKFIALLTAAAMILTLSSCSGETSEATTTPAATTPADTAAPEETTPEETDASEETTPEETDALEETTPEETDAPAESGDPMEILKANAPIYANYLEDQTNLPIRIGFAYEADLYGTGVASAVTMETIIKSPEEMALLTSTDGVEQHVIITADKYYMISPAEKTALYMDIDDTTRASLTETMTAGLSNTVQFDAANATYETGTEEYNGTEYLFEKISAPEMDAIVYADPATKEIKYLISGGTALEVTVFTHDVDESIFEVPSDYTLVSMADAMNAQ